jgi:CDP-glycerol glycerophosphotransferase
MGAIYSFFMLFPIKPNKILFLNHHGTGYGDSAKYIHKALIAKRDDLDCVWLISSSESISPIDGLRYAKRNSLVSMYEAATAGIWIFNTRSQLWMRKRKRQFYLQTWHGGLTVKSTEADLGDKVFSGYIKTAKADSKKADLFISNSKYQTGKFRTAFWYEGEILECGTPRHDIFFKESDSKKRGLFWDGLGLKQGTKLVIYAPTFRKSHTTENMNIDIHSVLLSLERSFGGEWVFLLRLHPIDAYFDVGFKEQRARFIDVTKLPDIYEVLPYIDVLITDYSSIMFDYMMTQKPVFIFAPDISEYMNERDFTMPLNSLPFSVSETTDALEKNIIGFDNAIYLQGVKDFWQANPIYETGHATEIITNRIMEEIDKRRR